MTAQLNFESPLDQQSRNGDNSRKGLERTIMDSNGQTKLFKWERYFGGPGRLRYNLIGVILCYFDVCCSKTEKQSSAGEKEVKYSDAFPKQTQNIHQLPTLARVQRWTAKQNGTGVVDLQVGQRSIFKVQVQRLVPKANKLSKKKVRQWHTEESMKFKSVCSSCSITWQKKDTVKMSKKWSSSSLTLPPPSP